MVLFLTLENRPKSRGANLGGPFVQSGLLLVVVFPKTTGHPPLRRYFLFSRRQKEAVAVAVAAACSIAAAASAVAVICLVLCCSIRSWRLTQFHALGPL